MKEICEYKMPWMICSHLLSEEKLFWLQELAQRAKKVVWDSPGLVDFAVGLVIFVPALARRARAVLGEIQITEGL